MQLSMRRMTACLWTICWFFFVNVFRRQVTVFITFVLLLQLVGMIALEPTQISCAEYCPDLLLYNSCCSGPWSRSSLCFRKKQEQTHSIGLFIGTRNSLVCAVSGYQVGKYECTNVGVRSAGFVIRSSFPNSHNVRCRLQSFVAMSYFHLKTLVARSETHVCIL